LYVIGPAGALFRCLPVCLHMFEKSFCKDLDFFGIFLIFTKGFLRSHLASLSL